ncbi:hypothetical protein ACFW9I_34110 [[Kitasatospora] papulosa]|uniref:hypothetical protein n=1 Tax=[Kitasatospora] papulosa TaxID=1464011 RepID=UPI00367E8D8F
MAESGKRQANITHAVFIKKVATLEQVPQNFERTLKDEDILQHMRDYLAWQEGKLGSSAELSDFVMGRRVAERVLRKSLLATERPHLFAQLTPQEQQQVVSLFGKNASPEVTLEPAPPSLAAGSSSREVLGSGSAASDEYQRMMEAAQQSTEVRAAREQRMRAAQQVLSGAEQQSFKRGQRVSSVPVSAASARVVSPYSQSARQAGGGASTRTSASTGSSPVSAPYTPSHLDPSVPMYWQAAGQHTFTSVPTHAPAAHASTPAGAAGPVSSSALPGAGQAHACAPSQALIASESFRAASSGAARPASGVSQPRATASVPGQTYSAASRWAPYTSSLVGALGPVPASQPDAGGGRAVGPVAAYGAARSVVRSPSAPAYTPAPFTSSLTGALGTVSPAALPGTGQARATAPVAVPVVHSSTAAAAHAYPVDRFADDALRQWVATNEETPAFQNRLRVHREALPTGVGESEYAADRESAEAIREQSVFPPWLWSHESSVVLLWEWKAADEWGRGGTAAASHQQQSHYSGHEQGPVNGPRR